MEEKIMPGIFRKLLKEGYIKETDILQTRDGFRMIYKSLSDILRERGITEFPDSEGRRLRCDRFYDDWFLYAVFDGEEHTCSLLKMREQEYDSEEDSPADGDTPGVTISFISFAHEVLLDCIAEPSDENRMKLDGEINRVVSRRGQRHHRVLKKYFKNPRSLGAYMVGKLYAKHIAAFAENGRLAVPEFYREIVKQSRLRKNSAKLSRLPQFIDSLNREAGYLVCDNEYIYLAKPEELNGHESAAILATHTGNTSLFSFAAEVEYHARFLIPAARMKIPLLGKSIYESAIRADMSVGDTEFEGPAPFYSQTSRIVKRQYSCHRNLSF